MATKTLKAKTTVKTAAKTAAKPAKEKKAKTTLKPVKASVAAAPLTVDDNLKKLAASKLPAAFVKEHNGSWNHQDWLKFLIAIKEKGFDPIDPDRVGLILEDLKKKLSGK